MTVTANDGRIEYTGDGSTLAFAYDFLLLDQAHVQVYVAGILKTITTHYTVSGVGVAGGGTVTFTAGNAPAASAAVLIIRNVPLTQEIDFLTANKFPAEVNESGLDKLTMITQQLTEQQGRFLALPITSLFENLTLPDPVSQRLLRWKTDLSGLENVAASDLSVFSGALITTQGDMVRGGAGGVPERFAVGTAGQVLTVVTGVPAWAAAPADPGAIPKTIVDAKGDLIVATAADTVTRRAVGTNGQVLTADSAQADGVKWATINILLHGKCRLTKSGVNLLLSPFDGNTLVINSAVETIPDAGVTLAATGLTADTTYYIYAYMNAGTMTLEASATAPATQAGTGIQIKTADATRSLVGLARIVTGPAWSDTATKRFVISYFNRRRIGGINIATADLTTASTTFVELSSGTLRVEFLTWADEAVDLFGVASVSIAAASTSLFTAFGIDSTTVAQEGGGWFAIITGNITGGVIPIRQTLALAEGYHYATMLGHVGAATASTWRGSATVGERTTMQVVIRG